MNVALTVLMMMPFSFAEKPANGPELSATAHREESRIRIIVENDVTVVDVHSDFGIDRATIERKADHWPKRLLFRLHLKGLESFKLSAGETAVEWSVSSVGEQGSRVTLWQGRQETPVARDNPHYSVVRIVSKNPQIPLPDGHFEIEVPACLLEGNPAKVSVRWIDFYRN